jgi:hypothetical protein
MQQHHSLYASTSSIITIEKISVTVCPEENHFLAAQVASTFIIIIYHLVIGRSKNGCWKFELLIEEITAEFLSIRERRHAVVRYVCR